jgi:putative ABC transport system substrate-binding protein
MRRREFIAGLGSAVAWPVVAWAQQPALPVIGWLGSGLPDATNADRMRAFHQSLSESGFVEGRNVTIEYRWANDQYDRLPALAADLVHRQVAVILASSGPSARAAKAATTTIPIVFTVAFDPVEVGLVASLNRPGGNLTGATNLSVELGPKLLQTLHEFTPTANIVAALINPDNPTSEIISRDFQMAARSLGLQLHVLNTSTDRDIETAFASLAQLRAGALVIGVDPFFNRRLEQLAALALRHAVPAICQYREFATAGGLMSYGGSSTDSYRTAGVYVGRILKGEKPNDLPVQQPTKFDLVINLKTAKALGLTIPETLLATADEVIQ